MCWSEDVIGKANRRVIYNPGMEERSQREQQLRQIAKEQMQMREFTQKKWLNFHREALELYHGPLGFFLLICYTQV